MIDDLFVVSFIADIHFGSMKSDLLYEQLEKRFIEKIDNKKIDMIVFGGDLFHNIITMNYSTSHLVLLFMEEVINLCKKNGIKYIRIIQGTMSHDNNQLHNFHMFENQSDVDFKIIMSVSEEHLVENIDILYVPEEYMSNPEEYYRNYLQHTKKYDFIFGHGMFKEVAFVAKNQDSEVTMSKAPVFDSKAFINACKGPIFFGHIHMKTIVRKHIYYPGSFSRFKHGEEDDKGFILCVYSTKTSKYMVEFVKNDLAPLYETITFTMCELYREHPDKIVDAVKMVEAENIKIKIILNDALDYSYAINYVREHYKDKSNIKIDITDNNEFKREKETEAVIDTVLKKYGFIFDKGIPHADKIQKFIEMKHGRTIPIDIIKDELSIQD